MQMEGQYVPVTAAGNGLDGVASWNSILYTTAQASSGAYVGGINYTNSYVCFHVAAPSNGLYQLFIRYATSSAYGPATHFLTVNGRRQGIVNYPQLPAGHRWNSAPLRGWWP